MKWFLQILSIFFYAQCFASTWQHHWHQGYEYFSKEQFQEAAFEFNQAVNLMTEEDYDKFPYVLADRAENCFYLENYPQVMLDTQKALKSDNLTDQERLTCGMRRISVLMILGDENAAIEEYKKYIIGCPLFPKYDFSKEKIVIRNIPNSECYKESTRKLMISQFCDNKNDISEYGNFWIVNVTKKCDCEKTNIKKEELPKQALKFSQRTENQIQACCNTVNRLAVAASVICGCVKTPFGPVTDTTCKVACAYFVETIREAGEWCCHHGGIEEKCWKNFETWKVDFKTENPDCTKPPLKCKE